MPEHDVNSTLVYASPQFNADYEHSMPNPPDPDDAWLTHTVC